MVDNVDGFDEIEQVIDGLDDFTDHGGPNTAKTTISETADRLFTEEVVPTAQQEGQQYVGEHATEIDDEAVGWVGDEYQHGLTTDSTVVEAHEYGTGRYNTRNPGAGAYRIPAEGDAGPLAVGPPGNKTVVEYVIHPGVKPKGFMQRAVQETADDFTDDLGDELVESLADQLGF